MSNLNLMLILGFGCGPALGMIIAAILYFCGVGRDY